MKRRKGRPGSGEGIHKPQEEPQKVESVATVVGTVEQPYAEFSQWLEGRLKGLEARFSHMITPRSRQRAVERRVWR